LKIFFHPEGKEMREMRAVGKAPRSIEKILRVNTPPLARGSSFLIRRHLFQEPEKESRDAERSETGCTRNPASCDGSGGLSERTLCQMMKIV
jgi:hypothetical protein